MNLAALYELHTDIPREGPGSDAMTQKALRRLPPLRPHPRIFDLGCGPGKHTLQLAARYRCPVVSVDCHQPYLERLRSAAARMHVEEWVRPTLGRLEALDEPRLSIDLIWVEAAIFVVGFKKGLRLWHPLLRPAGLLVVSEATWLDPSPPSDAVTYWNMAYPAMTSRTSNVAVAEQCGYEVIDHFVIPPSNWWDEYYTPLLERIATLRQTCCGHGPLAEMITATEREIAMVRRFPDAVGYVFYLMRKA